MAEYIEREALVELIAERNRNTCNGALSCLQMKRMVKSIPAADVAPVRHGRWKIIKSAIENAVCSCCGRRFQSYYEAYSYCPNCGAKMDKEDAE